MSNQENINHVTTFNVDFISFPPFASAQNDEFKLFWLRQFLVRNVPGYKVEVSSSADQFTGLHMAIII